MSSDFRSNQDLEHRLRQACLELDQRVRAGETDVAQQVLADQPDIAGDEELAIELIYREFVALEDLGAEPSPYEVLARFPQWRSRLQRLFKVHDALGGSTELDLDRASETLAGIDSTSADGSFRCTTADDHAPRRFGHYELLDEIDRGGMGIVYRARNCRLDRIVAIKSIRWANATPRERSRFRAEAESAAKLQHPNIVQIFDVAESDGRDFIAMEYVAGGSLEKRLRTERVSIHAAAQLIATLADTIHFAHERGVVHRDLKPGNILLDNDVPKIADFGLAKQMLNSQKANTQTGAVLGTPCYMSPEQAAGMSPAVGPPTDIYALGAILYELLVGQPPFMADNPLKIMDLIRSQEPQRPRTIKPSVPRDLETICLKCLAKDPAQRYRSGRELAADLNRFLDHQPIRARRVSWVERTWRWSRRRPAISSLALALAIVSFVGVVAFAWQQRHVGELSKSAAATKKKVKEIEQRAEAATTQADENLHTAKQAIQRLSLLGAALHDQPGMGEVALGTVKQALGQYRRLLDKHGDDHAVRWEAARAFDRAGSIQLELGKLDSAELTLTQSAQLYKTLNATAAIDFEKAGVAIDLGHCQRKLYQWKESEKSYNSAIEILEQLTKARPAQAAIAMRLANTLINLAVVLKHDGRTETAERVCCRAIRLQRQVIETAAKLTSGEQTVGDSSADSTRDEVLSAQALRREVGSQGRKEIVAVLVRRGYLSELAMSLDDLGSLLRRRGSIDLAETATREALELRQLGLQVAPHENWRKLYLARSHNHIGRLGLHQGDYEQATSSYRAGIELLEQLVEGYPHRVPYQSTLGTAYRNLGRTLSSSERTQEAMEFHDKAIAMHQNLVSNDPEVTMLKNDLARSIYHLGRTLRRSHRTAEANERFQRALDLDPELDQAANDLAWGLLMDNDPTQRDPGRALSLADQAVDLSPQTGDYWNTLGVAHYRNGNNKPAIDALTRSIELRDGGDCLDWFYLAMAHASQGEKRLAGKWYQRATQWCQSQSELPQDMRVAQEEAEATLGKNPAKSD